MFDTYRNNYPQQMNIKWYNNNTLLADVDYVVDNSTFFAQQNVTAYNKIVVSFNNMNKPYTYLKISDILDGTVIDFFDDEIIESSVIEEISINGEELPINILDVSILAKSDIDPMFIRTRPLKVVKDNELIGTFFINTTEYEDIYKINAVDYIGMLEYTTYLGGMYNGVSANTLIAEILGDIPYELDDAYNSSTIIGYLAIQTKRQALQQIAFVLGAVIDCSRENKIIIKPKNTVLNYELGNDKILKKKQSIGAIVTKISVVEHNYKLQSEATQIYEGSATNPTTILFSGAFSNLSITGGSIITSGTNYAIVQGSNVSLTGYAYEDSTKTVSKLNPNTSSTDLENEKIYDSTLISSNNSETILNNLIFNQKYYTIELLKGNEKIDDIVKVGNENLKITRIEYNIENKNSTAKMEVV